MIADALGRLNVPFCPARVDHSTAEGIGGISMRAVLVAVLIVVLFWGAVFMVALAGKGLTPLEFFFGRYEPLPPDLGAWKECGKTPDTGWVREERLMLPPGGSRASHLLRQVRYRDPQSGEIVRIEPEQRVRRRRVSARS